MNIHISNLQIIGQSSNSVIYHIPSPQNYSNSPQYALKVIHHDHEDPCLKECSLLQNDYETSQQFTCPNLLKHISYFPKTKGTLDLKCNEQQIIQISGFEGCAVMMECAQGGDLIDLVNKNSTQFYDLKIIKQIFRQVVLGLKEMHSLGFSHNDLKLDNILIFRSNESYSDCSSQKQQQQTANFNIKLADFGFSNKKHFSRSAQRSKFLMRQRDFLSPELLDLVTGSSSSKLYNTNYSTDSLCLEDFLMIDEQKSDVYALGISMLEAFAKLLPYKNPNGNRNEDPVYQAFINQQYRKFWRFFPKHYTMLERYSSQYNSEESVQEFFQLISSMIQPNPNQRISVEDILQTPFFQH